MIFNKKLIECCFNITDGEHSSVQNDKNGSFFLLSNKNIIDGQIKITPDDRRISLETYDKIHKRTKLAEGDILISTVGTLGKTAIIKGEINYDFQRSVGIIKCNPSILNPQYLYYFLNNPSIQKMLVNNSKGAVQKCIFINDLKELQINCPELTEQNTISKVLSCIDDKIALNNKINAKLEQMAKTLYDYWFIQFEFPDGNGGAYKSSNGPMTYNEVLKREIPTGWKVAPLKTLCDVKSGFPFSSDDYKTNSKYKLITIKNVLDRYISVDTDNTIESIPPKMPEYCLLKEGDILLSLTGNVGRVGMVFGENLLLNQRVGILNLKDHKWHSYLYLLFLQSSFRTLLEKISTGSNQKNLSPIETEALPIIIPSMDIVERFSNLTEPLLQKIIKNYQENNKLEKLRDFLLPMLMNGQIKVG